MPQPAVPHSGIGPITMPHPHSTRAPTYSGLVDNSIEDFLQEYEEFADSCGLTNRQKVEIITRYMMLDLREFWKSLNGYIASDWRDLKKELLRLYTGTSTQRRHSENQLRSYARASAKSRMKSEADVLCYYRQFIVLSKPLMDSQRLTPGAHDRLFW